MNIQIDHPRSHKKERFLHDFTNINQGNRFVAFDFFASLLRLLLLLPGFRCQRKTGRSFGTLLRRSVQRRLVATLCFGWKLGWASWRLKKTTIVGGFTVGSLSLFFVLGFWFVWLWLVLVVCWFLVLWFVIVWVVVGVLVWFWFGLVLGWFGVSYVRWFGFGFGLVWLAKKGSVKHHVYSSLMDLSARVLSTGYVHLFGISTGYILYSWSLSIQEAINYLEENLSLVENGGRICRDLFFCTDNYEICDLLANYFFCTSENSFKI